MGVCIKGEVKPGARFQNAGSTYYRFIFKMSTFDCVTSFLCVNEF